MPLTKHGELIRSEVSNSDFSEKKVLQVHGLDVKSLILMLDNENDDILMQNLLHLNRVNHEPDIMTLLDNELITQRLLETLVRSKDNVCLKKLCLKLMTSLVKTDSGKHVLCTNICSMQEFINILENREDSVMLELCLYIVSILTMNKDYCNYLMCRYTILSFLKDEMTNNVDIDIQYNCVKILENLMMHGLIQSRDDIPVSKIFQLFRHSGVERLQSSSLNTLYKLTELQDPYNNYGKEILTQFGSFAQAFDLVDIWPYDDQKIVLLYLIATLPLQYFDVTALKKLLVLLNNNPAAAYVNILVGLCANEFCQYYLNMMDIPHVLVKYFISENIEVSHVACQGVKILCERYHDYWQEISGDNAILNHIFQVLVDEMVEVQYKARFCELLLIMMQNAKCCKHIMGIEDELGSHASNLTLTKPVRTDILLDMAIQSEDEDLTCVILRCVYKLVSSHICIGQEQLEIIIRYFQSTSMQDDLKTETFLQILSLCLVNPTFVKLFIDLLGLETVNNFMRQRSEPKLLLAYGGLLINACNNVDLAVVINKLNIFQWLNKHNLYQQPPWHRITQSLLNINLPLKFAFCNVLDFLDITSDSFYVFKHLKHVNLSHFPDLNKILFNKDNERIVYVFSRDQTVIYKDNYIEKYISDITVFLGKTSTSSSDYSLLSNIEESDMVNDNIRGNIKPDLELIATYVVNQMNGSGDEINQLVNEEHLAEIVTEQESRVIPVGHVKVGLKFERCLLFKVLCDVFGYPCTLVRGEYDKDCYNQVVIECDNENFDYSVGNGEIVAHESEVLYYTVDLMSNPARLLFMGNSC